MPVLGSVGDLVEDIGVAIAGPINLASDTDAIVSRRRGGSAANVAVAAARIAGRAVFIGAVGDDRLGDMLVDELSRAGVFFAGRRSGRTGTIVLLIDHKGERTMLTDRGSSNELVDPEPSWLHGLDGLHLPFYSFAREPLATTSRTLTVWAHEREIPVSLDVSSTAVVESFGLGAFHDLLADVRPDIVFANEAEAALIGVEAAVDVRTVGVAPTTSFVVHGPSQAVVSTADHSIAVPAHELGPIADTTGAGDAFAAGYLTSVLSGGSPEEAAHKGHDAARDHLLRGTGNPGLA